MLSEAEKLPKDMAWLDSREMQQRIASYIIDSFQLENREANSIAEKIVMKFEEIGQILQHHPSTINSVLDSISEDKSIASYYEGMFQKLVNASTRTPALAKVANRALELKKYEKSYAPAVYEHFKVECAGIRMTLNLPVEEAQARLYEVISQATNVAMTDFRARIDAGLQAEQRATVSNKID